MNKYDVKLIWEAIKTRCFKRPFCRHDYKQINWYISYDKDHTRFSMRRYQCQKCGKKILVDGRNDKYRK